jgi:hypothetical protein
MMSDVPSEAPGSDTGADIAIVGIDGGNIIQIDEPVSIATSPKVDEFCSN